MRLAEEDKGILFAAVLMVFLGFWAASAHRSAARDGWAQYMCGDLYDGMTIEGQCQYRGG
jgi:hypothetical protein